MIIQNIGLILEGNNMNVSIYFGIVNNPGQHQLDVVVKRVR